MKNVFKTSGDRFIAVASDNTDSAVAVIDKNESGNYEYKRAALPGEVTLTPGESLTVSVDIANQMPDECNLVIIAAIYTNGTLAQTVVSNPMTVAKYTNETKSLEVPVSETVESGSMLKILVWNGLDGIKPLRSVSTPFN